MLLPLCGGQGVPCHMTLPHRLIPSPIKRARTLVSCIVVTVISVKFIAIQAVAAKCVAGDVCGCVSPRPKIPASRNIPFSRYVSPEHHTPATASRERLLLPERIPSRQASVDTPLIISPEQVGFTMAAFDTK
jgi:hypothetical protein